MQLTLKCDNNHGNKLAHRQQCRRCANKLDAAGRITVVETNQTETVKGARKISSPAPGVIRRRLVPWVSMLLLVAMAIPSLYLLAQEPRVIQFVADHDNKFKV